MNRLALAGLLLAVTLPVQARDERLSFPLQDALTNAEAKSRLDPGIALYFHHQPHPRVARSLGEWATNKKTNAFGKTDKTACEWAFLSAALELQQRARKEGGNAVIDIYSNYKNQPEKSATQYTCGAGGIMAGVALKGTVVTIQDK
ncbi:MAG: excinuclease ATPase subunit [Rhodocyclaceae bacterium]|nr:excinuclease ATPase subunit [Rhodocyclaceae bacterium]